MASNHIPFILISVLWCLSFVCTINKSYVMWSGADRRHSRYAARVIPQQSLLFQLGVCDSPQADDHPREQTYGSALVYKHCSL